MPSTPLVSVVIPVFNGLPYLQEATESVLAQTYANLDVVLVDGGSTDGSREWIHEITDPRVRIDALPAGTTAAGNWTHATQLARGEFVKLLCQDDLLEPDAVARQVSELEGRIECDLAISTRSIISASGKVLFRNRGLAGVPEGVVSGEHILRACYLSGANVVGEPHTVLFRKTALENAMPWEGDRPYLLDLDTFTKVLSKPNCQAVTAKRSIGAFRLSTSSWSTRLIGEQQAQFRTWQHEFETLRPTTLVDRLTARIAAARTALTRRLAYAYLRSRGDFS